MIDVQKLLAQRTRKFEEERVRVIQWIENLLAHTRQIAPKLLESEGITLPTGGTPEELVPSLFAENFVIEKYNEEIAVLEKLREKLNIIAEKLNEEAVKCLSR